MLPYKSGSLPTWSSCDKSLVAAAGKGKPFSCMAASAFQAYLYETLPPSTICIHTKMRDLHKMKQENHLSLRLEKVNGMDTLQMFTMKCFLSL